MVWSQLSEFNVLLDEKIAPTPLLKENYRRRIQDALKLTCTEKLKR